MPSFLASLAPASLGDRLLATRRTTEALAAPLTPEDCQAQSMEDASPVKWHLAHVTWFLETLVLEPHEAGFRPWNPAFRVLFNSYYRAVGERFPRPARGLLTRPALDEVLAWRRDVDARMARLLGDRVPAGLAWLVELAIEHEQQHQELLLTDVKHLLSCNPLQPAYHPSGWATDDAPASAATPLRWLPQPGGTVAIGVPADTDGFHFDNEGPRHAALLVPHAIAQRPVNAGEWIAFIEAGGYRDPRWWLDAGWTWRSAHEVQAPLYWYDEGGGRWSQFTLHGTQPVIADAPVVHVSFFEADAYARWRSAHDGRPYRLPTEFEWEALAAAAPVGHANFLEQGHHHPRSPRGAPDRVDQLFGDVWEWTASSYGPYPGYRPWSGAVGEYNGKFMSGQMVLRGGSCATAARQARATYRNFFPPGARWQFSGLRLACDPD